MEIKFILPSFLVNPFFLFLVLEMFLFLHQVSHHLLHLHHFHNFYSLLQPAFYLPLENAPKVLRLIIDCIIIIQPLENVLQPLLLHFLPLHPFLQISLSLSLLTVLLDHFFIQPLWKTSSSSECIGSRNWIQLIYFIMCWKIHLDLFHNVLIDSSWKISRQIYLFKRFLEFIWFKITNILLKVETSNWVCVFVTERFPLVKEQGS